MRALDPWVEVACAELGLEPAEARVPLVLDLARDVAHHVLRPGAPVTAYLLGLAVGRGADPVDAAARLTALTATWPPVADPHVSDPHVSDPHVSDPPAP